MSLQIVNVIGNATKDAEQKSSKDGIIYLTFRIAATGTQEKPIFYNIVVFGHYGEVLKDMITKGREVCVSGRLEINEKGYISVVANHVELLRFPKSKKREEQKEDWREKGKETEREDQIWTSNQEEDWRV